MPVTTALTSHTSPLPHQAIARPTGAITQVYSHRAGTTTRYRASHARTVYTPIPIAASTAPSPLSTHITARPTGVSRWAYTQPSAAPRPLAAHAIACPAGVSTYRYSHTRGMTTSTLPSHPRALPTGTTTYRHSPTNGQTNTARPSHSSARPTGRNSTSFRNRPATTSASHTIRTGTTSTSTTIRTGIRIATERHPSGAVPSRTGGAGGSGALLRRSTRASEPSRAGFSTSIPSKTPQQPVRIQHRTVPPRSPADPPPGAMIIRVTRSRPEPAAAGATPGNHAGRTRESPANWSARSPAPARAPGPGPGPPG